jgi:hypothetical protein
MLFDFSCPALPLLKPISPSLSSSFFLRPQILHATINRPASTMAPPTPTTTPMTVLFVFGDMVEEEEASFWASVAELVDLEEDEVPVEDEEEVWLPGTICVVVNWL